MAPHSSYSTPWTIPTQVFHPRQSWHTSLFFHSISAFGLVLDHKSSSYIRLSFSLKKPILWSRWCWLWWVMTYNGESDSMTGRVNRFTNTTNWRSTNPGKRVVGIIDEHFDVWTNDSSVDNSFETDTFLTNSWLFMVIVCFWISRQ